MGRNQQRRVKNCSKWYRRKTRSQGECPRSQRNEENTWRRKWSSGSNAVESFRNKNISWYLAMRRSLVILMRAVKRYGGWTSVRSGEQSFACLTFHPPHPFFLTVFYISGKYSFQYSSPTGFRPDLVYRRSWQETRGEKKRQKPENRTSHSPCISSNGSGYHWIIFSVWSKFPLGRPTEVTASIEIWKQYFLPLSL